MTKTKKLIPSINSVFFFLFDIIPACHLQGSSSSLLGCRMKHVHMFTSQNGPIFPYIVHFSSNILKQNSLVST